MKLSIEVLTKQVSEFTKEFALGSLNKDEVWVMLPHINGTRYKEVIEASQVLLDLGFQVVPHLATRNLGNEDSLQEINEFLAQCAGVLLLGGDNSKPTIFNGVMDFINKNWELEAPVKNVFFSTFPEGHPHIKDDENRINTQKKCAWAKKLGLECFLINQICFDKDPIVANHRQLLVDVPSANQLVSFVAPCKISKLVKVAAISGIQNSLSFLKKVNVMKLLGTYDSNELVDELRLENTSFNGLHAYSFGNYEGSVEKLSKYQAILRPL